VTGIIAYGAHIPRLRLQREAIADHVAWLVPGVSGLAHGEKAIGNWDEDSVTMAVSAARDCLVGIGKARVDALYLASTTLPFADRLNAGIVATALNLGDELLAADFTSTQKAATTALTTALEIAGGTAGRTVLVVASDRREARAGSAYEMLLGDGAAALLVGRDDVIAEFEGSYSVSHDFVDHYRGAERRFDYTWEERWIREEGYAKIIPQSVGGLLAKLDLDLVDVDRLVFPTLNRRDHALVARALGAAPEKVVDNLQLVCGETGAAHPLVMLVAALEQAEPGERVVVASFGQGSDALSFRVTERIRELTRRSGVAGSLARRAETRNYMKYLRFRELVTTEEGLRAEAPTQTALTALWRNRKMVLGLVGGKCRECGTPQFPQQDICVNPACGAVGAQDDYEFADVPATVKSFTGDALAVSPDPPAIYGMVEFEGGGRFIADFTDCTLEEVRVGLPVRMVFRKHATDKERGFTGYFWKAVPQVDAVAGREGTM
jgi:3-hydroxy-3-methylglutaryl CoA synthase